MADPTPGPWGQSEIGILTNEGGKPIMGPDGFGDFKRIALVDCQMRYKRGEGWKTDCPEREANARLIAAAPELLAAAIYAVQQMADGDEPEIDDDGDEVEPFARLRAAISKARGDQP